MREYGKQERREKKMVIGGEDQENEDKREQKRRCDKLSDKRRGRGREDSEDGGRED